jgi:hypothetical protein
MIKLTCLVALAGVSAMPLVAQAQSYPVRSITVVVPFPAGGPSDVVARIVTERMGRMLGQQMVIEIPCSQLTTCSHPAMWRRRCLHRIPSTTQRATLNRSASPRMRPP